MNEIVKITDVVKTFGDVTALAGVSLTMEQGSVLGLLGPNGAGKTTLVNILATLSLPDSGSASVDGVDVASDPQTVRSLIGLAGQFAAVDEVLTGRENLEMVGQLYGLSRSVAVERATATLERLTLNDAADRPVKTYSGGMRRRLDLGASLVGRPRLLLLDEPTTGLDPRTRNELWRFIEDLVADGTTVLLTTQYLEEADRLADEIVVIDHGRVIAQGTSEELKTRLGGDMLDFEPRYRRDLTTSAELVGGVAGTPQVDEEAGRIRVPVGERSGPDVLTEAARLLDDAGIELVDLGIRRPSLDDVFLSITGRPAETTDASTDQPAQNAGTEATR